MSTLGLFVSAFVVLSAIFGALVRSWSWRTTAVLAAVLSAVAAMGVFLPWQGRDAVPLSSFRTRGFPTGWIDDGWDGTFEQFHGPYVLLLAGIAGVSAMRVAVRERLGVGERQGLVAALALTAALGLLGIDLKFCVRYETWTQDDGNTWRITERAGAGILLTTVAALFGAGCAWATYRKTRTAARAHERASPASKPAP